MNETSNVELLQATVHQPLQKSSPIPWVQVAPGAPYFITEEGKSWTPIGQNDAITWPTLAPLFLQQNKGDVDAYLQMLSAKGITCLRLMLEYCQGENRYFEKPVGRFQPNMVQWWDDMFELCEKHGIRLLLTPFDTFWMWRRWKHHPYKKSNGGPCPARSQWFTCQHTRAAIKNRLLFATQRWGGSGALFAWDIWNEISPAYSKNDASRIVEFVQDISTFLRQTEITYHGKAHPQTLSVYGPLLQKCPQLIKTVFQHPTLQFASSHFYDADTIDYPKNTIEAAVKTAQLTAEAISYIQDNRPFLDSESGPIHLFANKKVTLPEAFDDEYFRFMQWAHLASGGAGGGLRWPYRHPHCLTAGMHKAQKALATFASHINFKHFNRTAWNNKVTVSCADVFACGCGNNHMGIVWAVRTHNKRRRTMLNVKANPLSCYINIPIQQKGTYKIQYWCTLTGEAFLEKEVIHVTAENLSIPVENFVTDMAITVMLTGNYCV